ncbi:MAG: tail fiber domain-containing protein, partial [Sediminibacterium sp.]
SVTTANQPLITTVGTLINLTVANSINAANLTISGTTTTGVLSTALANITNISGLQSLNVAGAIDAASISASVTTANQPLITTVGTLINLTVANSIIAENITVSGTLTANSLSITDGSILGGNLSVAGNITSAAISSSNGYMDALKVSTTISANTLTAINVTVSNLTNFSDLRFKKNISNLSSSLSGILSLRPVSYNWRNPAFGTNRQVGFIAQDVRKIFPDLVAEDKNGNLSVNYSGMVSPMVKAMQEQQKQIEDLKKQNSELQQRLDKIEQMLKKFSLKK